MAEEYKGPTPVSRSSLIPIQNKCFYNMQDASELDAMEHDPGAAWHRRALDGLKAQGKVRDDSVLEESSGVRVIRDPKNKHFRTGSQVVDNDKQKKGIIIAASVGYTKKRKTPVHRVADKRGKTWLAKETDLTLTY